MRTTYGYHAPARAQEVTPVRMPDGSPLASEAGVAILACALVLFAALPSAADAPGARGLRIIGADATRNIVIDYLSAERPLLLVRRDGHATPLHLDNFGSGQLDYVQAKITPFGHADLFDIAVSRAWKRDDAFTTMHYLVRANELVVASKGTAGGATARRRRSGRWPRCAHSRTSRSASKSATRRERKRRPAPGCARGPLGISCQRAARAS